MTIDQKIINALSGVDKAVLLAGRDGRAVLASTLGVSRQAIHQYVQQRWMPIDRARVVHQLFGIPMVELVKPETAARKTAQ